MCINNNSQMFTPLKKLKTIFNRVQNLLKRDPNKFLNEVSGAIHVGANTGQERKIYEAYGLKIIWIEPIPEIFRELEDNIKDCPEQRALECLVTDKDNLDYQFYISNNHGESSSILDFNLHKDIWPEVAYEKTLTIKSKTLSSLLKEKNIDCTEYDSLIMDTQGTELLVLKGAVPLLENFTFIKTEVADFEAYTDCCRLTDIASFMKIHGFEELFRHKFAKRKAGGNYYDVIYKQKSRQKRFSYMEIKSQIKHFLGEANTGILEYYLKPEYKNIWGGPFNGQEYRKSIFLDIIKSLPVKAIVETGTFRGTTTSFFSTFSLPVHSVENNERHFAYSKRRLRKNKKNIFLYKQDSRIFLRSLAQRDLVPKKNIFFYLDAHWEKDLPLREELEIIFSKWKNAIVMVDDFQVPGTDYFFDNYGKGRILNLDYLQPLLSKFSLSVFFPKADAAEETGSKCGSVVLCKEEETADEIAKIYSLRKDTSFPVNE